MFFSKHDVSKEYVFRLYSIYVRISNVSLDRTERRYNSYLVYDDNKVYVSFYESTTHQQQWPKA